MAVKDFKANVHKLIDELDEDVIERVYEFMSGFKKSHSKRGQKDWWDELTEAHKKDLLLALEELKRQYNIVSHEDAKAMIKKWAKR